MKLALTVLVFVAALATQASGVVETSASTESFLASMNSDQVAIRTISKSSVTSPELFYKSDVQVDTTTDQPGGGAAIISQSVQSTAQNYYGSLGGGATFSSKVIATNTNGTNLVMTGKSEAVVCYSEEYAMVKSETFGMGIAKPEEGEYIFEVKGDQKTVSTTMPAPVLVVMNNDEFLNKELTVTFRQNSLDLEEPADLLEQEVNFNYGTYNNQPTFYNYDFTSNLVIDDTTCSSYMSFSHVN